MLHYGGATLLVILAIAPPIEPSTSDWNNPTSSQYHIQTDEGPERYFRYQTDSGQYRKEKRLDDGTVIGTYAWIDDNGFLRQRDYIADNAGYRILKTKNLFVGRNTPIAQAIKAAKKAPASAGTLVKPSGVPLPKPTIGPNVTPFVEINNNAIPSSTPLPILSSTPSTAYLPSSTPSSTYLPSSTPSTAYLPSSTSSPVYIASSEYLPANTVSIPSTPRPFSINPWYYNSAPQYDHPKRDPYPFKFQNGPTYPIDNRGQTYTGSNSIGNGYDPQYDYYDGVSVTNDGFRYYIPRAYHEEQNLGDDKKSGSFGYIDPFGIRRVIYYNAGPGTGFQHRKNNRYVGFDATPYDPRPY